MRCQNARELLSARQDGALTPHADTALGAHVADCAGCQIHEKNLTTLLRALRAQAANAASAPDDVRQRLAATFGAPRASRTRRRARGWLVTAAGAAACVLIIAWWLVRPRTTYLESATGRPTVQVIRAGAPLALGPGQGLHDDDLVHTREAASARIRLGQHVVLDLGPASRLRVLGPAAAFLASGSASFDVRPGQGGLRVETPAGDVIVTGTAFDVEVVPLKKEREPMKPMTIGIFGGALIGAVATVQVSRGSVSLRAAGESLPLAAGQSGQMRTGRAPGYARADGAGPEQRLAEQNANLRRGLEDLKVQVARRLAQAAAMPAPGKVATSNDPRAPLTSDERKLLGAANLRVSAETRDKLAAVYQEVHRKAPPAALDELSLAKELLVDLRLAHTAGPPPRPTMPPAAAKTMQLVTERNRRVKEELAKTLPPERAAAVAATIKAATTVGIVNGRHQPGHVTLEVPPGEGKPLPAPPAEKQNK